MKLKFVFLCLVLSACSFKKSPLENQSSKGHTELYSIPEAPKLEENKGVKRVVIAATNDLQGHYAAHEITFKDGNHPERQSVRMGGVNFISSYFKILRQHYGQILLVDSGDIFPEKTQEMKFVQDFYSVLDYDALTVGLRDFNLKLPGNVSSSSDFFKKFSSSSNTPLILSNLYELKTARVVEWPGTLPYMIKEINGVKVGIIGLIPDDIVGQTPVDNRVGLFVENMLQSTLRHARLMRSLGAELIVVLTHQSISCGEDIAQEMKLPLSKVNFEPSRSEICEMSSKMGEYLNRLPPHLVDVIIGGRNHQKTANFVNTTLVLNSFEDGKSFSFAEFFVDKSTKQVIKEKTIVHQPVQFCHEFFKETSDCYYEDQSVDHKARVPAKFLGQPVEPDLSLEKKFKPYLEEAAKSSAKTSSQAIQKILDFHHGDISYRDQGLGSSKLMILTLSGADLLNVLEEDYNQGHKSSWHPSPFKLVENTLSVTLQGMNINKSQSYKVLADLEDLQKHHVLKKFISVVGAKTINSASWNEPTDGADNVTTVMSSLEAVR